MRLALAREKNIPAYAVFHDAVLKDFATQKPQSRTEFEQINGVGPKKLDRYFDAFVAVIQGNG
jgi:ATP-dependent DNA helicase RecQ